jgi:hypothetical protein
MVANNCGMAVTGHLGQGLLSVTIALAMAATAVAARVGRVLSLNWARVASQKL